jgi:hypothetical protein
MAAPIVKGPLGSDKAAQQLNQLEVKIEHLRRKFQMYFQGFDRSPPSLEFEAVKREFRELQSQVFSTAQARFKAQNLMAKFQIMRNSWERDLQRVENGELKVGLMAVKRNQQALKVDEIE